MFRLKTLLVAAFASALVFPLSLPLPVENFPTSMSEAQAAGKKSHKKDKRKAYKKARRKAGRLARGGGTVYDGVCGQSLLGRGDA